MTAPFDPIARAQAAHPSFTIPSAEFAAYVDERVAADDRATAYIDDLYLACGCARGNPAAIAAFDAAHNDVIAAAVRRLDGSPDLRDEAAQRARQRLLVAAPGALPRIAQYSGRAPLSSFVRVVAVREALGGARGVRRPTGGNEVLDGLASEEDGPELIYLKQLYADEFRAAFEAALASLSARERALLRYQIVERLDLGQIAAIYGRPRSTMGRHVLDARRALIAATHQQLQRQLQVDRSVLDSVLRIVRSSVDVSVRRLLSEGGSPAGMP